MLPHWEMVNKIVSKTDGQINLIMLFISQLNTYLSTQPTAFKGDEEALPYLKRLVRENRAEATQSQVKWGDDGSGGQGYVGFLGTY